MLGIFREHERELFAGEFELAGVEGGAAFLVEDVEVVLGTDDGSAEPQEGGCDGEAEAGVFSWRGGGLARLILPDIAGRQVKAEPDSLQCGKMPAGAPGAPQEYFTSLRGSISKVSTCCVSTDCFTTSWRNLK